MSKGRCKNCECWEVNDKGTAGICKARAPQAAVMVPTVVELTLVRPSTAPDDWCQHDYVESD